MITVIKEDGKRLFVASTALLFGLRKEETMYGYTSPIPVFTRLQNLAEQLPENIRAIALGQCCEDNPYDFERVLTGFVMTWNEDKAEQERQAAEASEITDELLTAPLSEEVSALVDEALYKHQQDAPVKFPHKMNEFVEEGYGNDDDLPAFAIGR